MIRVRAGRSQHVFGVGVDEPAHLRIARGDLEKIGVTVEVGDCCVHNLAPTNFSDRRDHARAGFDDQSRPTERFFEVIGVTAKHAVKTADFHEHAGFSEHALDLTTGMSSRIRAVHDRFLAVFGAPTREHQHGDKVRAS